MEFREKGKWGGFLNQPVLKKKGGKSHFSAPKWGWNFKAGNSPFSRGILLWIFGVAAPGAGIPSPSPLWNFFGGEIRHLWESRRFPGVLGIFFVVVFLGIPGEGRFLQLVPGWILPGFGLGVLGDLGIWGDWGSSGRPGQPREGWGGVSYRILGFFGKKHGNSLLNPSPEIP